ncbi:MAG TPA: glycosyltransferase [Chitinophagales bacterium]|nr:glycosyltransferase [Chitinophagales bacterium]
MSLNKTGGAIIPEVSVCVITYNQEKYIAQAIEGALMQLCDFTIELVICDDSSTDQTPAIIQAYAERFPEKIKVYPAPANMGMLRNWERALKLCRGKYIALLEGDDFWTDEKKMQKQVTILRANPQCSISATNAIIKYESGENGYPEYAHHTTGIYPASELGKNNFIPTCSVVMRNNISDSFFHPSYYKSPFADWIIHILNTKFGSIHFLNEFTCTYRVHSTGVWGSLKEEAQLLNRFKAINCVAEIVTDGATAAAVRNTRKELLQQLCAFYKTNKHWVNYAKYRIELLLN